MSITIHQSASLVNPAGAVAHQISFSTTPTVGRLCVALVSWGNGFNSFVTDLGVSDNQGNTYTRRSGHDWQRLGTRIYTAPIETASGTFTLTLTFTGAPEWAVGDVCVSIVEVSGHDAASVIDQSGYATGTTEIASVALDSMAEDTVVFAVARHEYQLTPTGFGDWTAISAESDSGFATLYRVGDYDPAVTFAGFDGISWWMAAAGISAANAASAPSKSMSYYYRTLGAT